MNGLSNDLMTRRTQDMYMVSGKTPDRSPSLLTDSHRSYLIEKPEPDDYQRKKRGRMRSRIRHGLMDLSLLNSHIEERDLRQIFDKRLGEATGRAENLKYGSLPEAKTPGFEDTAMAHIAVTHMVAFAWRGLRAIGNEPESIIDEAIMRGVWNGEADHRGISRSLISVDYDFDLEVHSNAAVNPLEKWKRDLPLNTSERAELHEQLIEAVPEEVYQSSTPGDFDDLVAEYLVSEE